MRQLTKDRGKSPLSSTHLRGRKSLNTSSSSAPAARITRATTRMHQQNNDAESIQTTNTTYTFDSTDDIWFEICTSNMFKNFQRYIYPLIISIVEKPEYQQHPFIKQWNDMRNKYVINERTSFPTLKRHFHFEDVKAYATFIQQCPEIKQYIIIRPVKHIPHGIEFGIKPKQNDPQESDDLTSYDMITKLTTESDLQEITLFITIVVTLLQDHLLTYPDDE
jgi:hypothetical protein